MQNLIENTSRQNKKDEKDGEEKKNRPIIKTATDLQRLKLEKLMKNPEKPIIIPESPREKDYLQTVPSFVRNVMGSSAGAGSGEFHVYRHLRRKEYARQKCIHAKSMREKLDEEYQMKLEKNRLESECKTAKKRAKRLKKKQHAKKPKVPQNDNGVEEQNEKQSTSEDDDDDEKDEDENHTQKEEPKEKAECDSDLEKKLQVKDNDGGTCEDIVDTISKEGTNITSTEHRPEQNEDTSIENKVIEEPEKDQMKIETKKDGESKELRSADKEIQKDIQKDVDQDLNVKETTIAEQVYLP